MIQSGFRSLNGLDSEPEPKKRRARPDEGAFKALP